MIKQETDKKRAVGGWGGSPALAAEKEVQAAVESVADLFEKGLASFPSHKLFEQRISAFKTAACEVISREGTSATPSGAPGTDRPEYRAVAAADELILLALKRLCGFQIGKQDLDPKRLTALASEEFGELNKFRNALAQDLLPAMNVIRRRPEVIAAIGKVVAKDTPMFEIPGRSTIPLKFE